MSTSSRQKTGTFARIAILCGALAFSAASHAEQTCEDLCAEVAKIQGYSTGSQDPVCTQACEGETQCPDAWEAYFTCVKDGGSGAVCFDLYAAAKVCSVCDEGEGDDEGAGNVYLVDNRDPALCSDSGSGVFPQRLCSVSEAVDRSLANQYSAGNATKVFVCPGVYRQDQAQGLRRLGANSEQVRSPVIVESVVRGQAFVRGSQDWSNDFEADTLEYDETVWNLVTNSADLTAEEWTPVELEVLDPSGFPDAPPPPPVCAECDSPQPGDVWRAIPNTVYGTHQLQVNLDDSEELSEGRMTASFYLRPAGWRHFRLDMLLDPPTQGLSGQGAVFDFELPKPAAGACRRFTRLGTEGAEVEAVGDGWYRVHLAAPVRDGYRLAAMRLFFLEPAGTRIVNRFSVAGDGVAGVDLFGPQVDRRPLVEFATDTRAYLRTQGAPVDVEFHRQLAVLESSSKPWPHDWGVAEVADYLPPMRPIARRAEQVFFGGEPLRQELAFQDLREGSFILVDGLDYSDDFSDDAARQAGGCDGIDCIFYLVPPAGWIEGDHLIEVSEAGRLLYLNPISDWQVRGLTFDHASGVTELTGPNHPIPPYTQPLQSAAVTFHNASDLTLVANRAEWNNANGIAVAGLGGPSNNIDLVANVAHANGIAGAYLAQAGGFVADGEVWTSNSWRADRGGLHGAITSGAKYSINEGGLITGLWVGDNHSHGLWLDSLNTVTVSGSSFVGNGDAGVHLEANPGTPTGPWNVVTGSFFHGNRIAIRGQKSSAVEVESNTFADNKLAFELLGMVAQLEVDGLPVTVDLVDWSIQDNQVEASCRGDLFVNYAGTASQWVDFRWTHQRGGNTWTHAEGNGECAFEIRGNHTIEAFWECDPQFPSLCMWPPATWCGLFP